MSASVDTIQCCLNCKDRKVFINNNNQLVSCHTVCDKYKEESKRVKEIAQIKNEKARLDNASYSDWWIKWKERNNGR